MKSKTTDILLHTALHYCCQCSALFVAENCVLLVAKNSALLIAAYILEQHLSAIVDIDGKLACLFFAKKVLPYLKREPDATHFLAFEEEYRNDRLFFEPMKWTDNEIEFWTNIKAFDKPKEASQSIVEAKMELSKQWLTKDEIMEMLKLSRTTLNRRIAEGMPCHQKGKAVFFNLEEVSEWLKEDEAA